MAKTLDHSQLSPVQVDDKTLYIPRHRLKEAILEVVSEYRVYIRMFATSGMNTLLGHPDGLRLWQSALKEIGTSADEILHFVAPPFHQEMEDGLQEPTERDVALARFVNLQVYGRQIAHLVNRIRQSIITKPSSIFRIPEDSDYWHNHAHHCPHHIRPAIINEHPQHEHFATGRKVAELIKDDLDEALVNLVKSKDEVSRLNRELDQTVTEKDALQNEVGIAKRHVSRLLEKVRIHSPVQISSPPLTSNLLLLLPTPSLPTSPHFDLIEIDSETESEIDSASTTAVADQAVWYQDMEDVE